jgi:hypothetical protein
MSEKWGPVRDRTVHAHPALGLVQVTCAWSEKYGGYIATIWGKTRNILVDNGKAGYDTLPEAMSAAVDRLEDEINLLIGQLEGFREQAAQLATEAADAA